MPITSFLHEDVSMTANTYAKWIPPAGRAGGFAL
jgi:hypothetical protein